MIYRYIRREEPTHKGRESLPPAQTGRRTASRQTATENKQPNDSRAEQKDGRHQTNRKQTDSRAEKHPNRQPTPWTADTGSRTKRTEQDRQPQTRAHPNKQPKQTAERTKTRTKYLNKKKENT